MTPRTCCQVLAHGVPVCLAGRIDKPETLLAFLGSLCAGPTPLRFGLPSHSTLQPLLEASVMPIFLLCAVSKITPCFSKKDPSNGRGLIHRPESLLRGGIHDAKSRMEPSASARTGWVAFKADPTEVPAKPLP